MFHRRGETELGHVSIDTFKLIGVDCISLMPDAYNSIRANRLIKISSTDLNVGRMGRARNSPGLQTSANIGLERVR